MLGTIKIKRTALIISFLLIETLGYSQSDTLTEFPYDYREHFSGKKRKWHVSGQRLYKDNVIYYTDVYGSDFDDSTVYYFERKWYYPNGNKRQYIFVDFKKPRRARIIEQSFTESGELIDNILMTAKRLPEHNSPEKVEWEQKK